MDPSRPTKTTKHGRVRPKQYAKQYTMAAVQRASGDEERRTSAPIHDDTVTVECPGDDSTASASTACAAQDDNSMDYALLGNTSPDLERDWFRYVFGVVDDDDEAAHRVDDDSEQDWFFDVFPEQVDSEESSNGEIYDEQGDDGANEPSETEPI